MSWYLQMATSVSLADSSAGVQFPAADGFSISNISNYSTKDSIML